MRRFVLAADLAATTLAVIAFGVTGRLWLFAGVLAGAAGAGVLAGLERSAT